MDDDGKVILELSLLGKEVRKEVRILDSFLIFLKSYEEKKTHNTFSLMLDPRFKGFRFVSSLLGVSRECLLCKKT
jgi:hypothetical protein